MRAWMGAALAGLLVTLGLPPFGWWPLPILGFAMLTTSVAPARSRGIVFGRMMVFGVGWFGPGLWWMTQFSRPGWILVVLLESLIGAACMVGASGRRSSAWRMVAGVTVGEIVRTRLPLVALPLAGIDLAQARGPLSGLVVLGGRALLVVTVASVAVLLGSIALPTGAPATQDNWSALGPGRSARTAVLVTMATLALVVAMLGPVGTRAVAGSLRVALVQGGGPRGQIASPALAVQTYDAQIAATRRLAGPIDLIVWPEDAVDLVRLAARSNEVDSALADIARAHHATFVVGAVSPEGPTHFRNFVLVYGPDGAHIDRYEKAVRVPFGEFFPARPLLRVLGIRVPRRDAIAGSGQGIVNTPSGPFAVAISYEGFFPGRVRGGVRAGGEAVLIPTNASSYRSTQVPTQQLAAARLRARESGRWVLQVGPTGYSAAVDPHGRVQWRSRLGDAVVKIVTIERRTGLTPGQQLDTDLVVLGIVETALVIGWWRVRWRLRRSRRKRANLSDRSAS